MRQSKKSGSDLAITDVLRVVSSSAQEDFNAAMRAAYGGDCAEEEQPRKTQLQEIGPDQSPSAKTGDGEHLVGADLWMLDSANLPEQNHVSDKQTPCAALVHLDLFPLKETGFTRTPTDRTSLPIKHVSSRTKIRTKSVALENDESAYFFRVMEVGEPVRGDPPAGAILNAQNDVRKRSGTRKVAAGVAAGVAASVAASVAGDALSNPTTVTAGGSSLQESIAGHVEQIERLLVQPQTQGFNDLVKKLFGKLNVRSASAAGS